jgi:multiple sugar transport system substrate-binding protein
MSKRTLRAMVLVAAAVLVGALAASAAFSSTHKSSAKPVTLRFIWFEWPPAHALEAFANANYKKLHPNVTVKVDTVPIGNWHDAIFTQFAAKKTTFDIPVLDSQFIGEAVTNGDIIDLTKWATSNIDLKAYPSYLLAAYGQYPQTVTGHYDKGAHLYGLPLLGDTWVMVYRKDLIKSAPTTWSGMLAAAKKCQAANPGMYGLAFHGNKDYDGAAVTFNTVDWNYGGQIWNPKTKQIDGVINDSHGKKAMNVLSQMVKLSPPGSGNWFINEVNAAINQGKVCIGLQWVAGLGVTDPKQSTLGKTKAQILKKLGFAVLPRQVARVTPLGGMGMHVSAFSKNQQAALDFIKWFEQPGTQKAWAAAGGVPARTDALHSPQFLNATPWNRYYTQSVPYLRDFWNIPQYAKLLQIEASDVNAALTGTKDPIKALNDIAKRQQAVLKGGGLG